MSVSRMPTSRSDKFTAFSFCTPDLDECPDLHLGNGLIPTLPSGCKSGPYDFQTWYNDNRVPLAGKQAAEPPCFSEKTTLPRLFRAARRAHFRRLWRSGGVRIGPRNGRRAVSTVSESLRLTVSAVIPRPCNPISAMLWQERIGSGDPAIRNPDGSVIAEIGNLSSVSPSSDSDHKLKDYLLLRQYPLHAISQKRRDIVERFTPKSLEEQRLRSQIAFGVPILIAERRHRCLQRTRLRQNWIQQRWRSVLFTDESQNCLDRHTLPNSLQSSIFKTN
ncbi:hypothetical protein CAPTEDRAFT_213414 [Capitella teleta]|uniref:Uncharacterized protein n=1 Tax=Capitella teleta TaxID=283909 RepID=R7UVX8_CAPTE|nr:hypothetical protein CAPTEDRAFT_213414 [Capitella teleta]|eukprot:ELU08077.1 hypothetical protein CAPTEDRAFT_213414 [Capitella teleta]